MKHFPLSRAGLSLIAATCFGLPQASALIELDRGVIILNTQASISYDSNILGQLNNESDTLLSFSPNLEYRREGGRGSISVTLGSHFVHYLEADERDHGDYSLSGRVTVPVSPDSPFSGSFDASIANATKVDETVGNLVESDSLRFGGNAAYAFSERLSGTGGISWGSNKNDNYGDNQAFNLSLGVSLQEFLLRRLPLSISYGYSNSKSTNDLGSTRALNTTSHSLNLGTNGRISPKVTGSVSVGVRNTDDNGTSFASQQGNDTGAVASTSLTWAASELTNVSLSLSKSLGVTTDNQSIDTTRIGLSWNRQWSELISLNAGVSHSWNDYRSMNRDDKFIALNAGLSYRLRRNWTAGLTYSYTDNNSNIRTSDFQRHVVSASVSASF